MEQWTQKASEYGLIGLVLLALGLFIYKKLWPVIEKRLADADLREKENLQRWEDQGKLFAESLRHEREDNSRRFEDQGKIFMESLRVQQVLAAETHRESIKTQNKIADKLETIDRRIRNGSGK